MPKDANGNRLRFAVSRGNLADTADKVILHRQLLVDEKTDNPRADGAEELRQPRRIRPIRIQTIVDALIQHRHDGIFVRLLIRARYHRRAGKAKKDEKSYE